MHNLKNSGREFANLDLLRSVAVLSVFFAHLYETVTHRKTELAWHFGQMGVLIFFVHTSLVLMQSLERLEREGSSLFIPFYLRRMFRIYPLSVFCVLSAYLFGIPAEFDQAARSWNLKELFANLSLTQNLFYTDSMVGGLWTLPLEVQMYVALPFLFVIFRQRPLKGLFALWAAAVPLALIQPHITGRLDVMGYVPCFLGGVLAWRMCHLYKPRLPGWAWPWGFASVCVVWMAASREHNMYYRWAFCFLLGCAIPWFQEIPWRWVARSSKWVAQYSYGIYLSHVALMALCFRGLSGLGPMVKWLIFATLAVGTPIAMYHWLEHPMIVLGKKLTDRYVVKRKVNGG